MILETDMTKHFDALGKFRSRALSIKENFALDVLDDKILMLKIAIKSGDIGHSCKE